MGALPPESDYWCGGKLAGHMTGSVSWLSAHELAWNICNKSLPSGSLNPVTDACLVSLGNFSVLEILNHDHWINTTPDLKRGVWYSQEWPRAPHAQVLQYRYRDDKKVLNQWYEAYRSACLCTGIGMLICAQACWLCYNLWFGIIFGPMLLLVLLRLFSIVAWSFLEWLLLKSSRLCRLWLNDQPWYDPVHWCQRQSLDPYSWYEDHCCLWVEEAGLHMRRRTLQWLPRTRHRHPMLPSAVTTFFNKSGAGFRALN